MPHLVLEYSDNVIEKNNFSQLFQQCHQILADMLPTDLMNCKSRAIECPVYYVADGKPDNAFVHLSLKIMAGRTDETLRKLGDQLMETVMEHFAESLKKKRLQISLEISSLDKNYFKM